ncbi:MAG: polymer-forming cytoskeletal protein [Pseudomonadota bacterium]
MFTKKPEKDVGSPDVPMAAPAAAPMASVPPKPPAPQPIQARPAPTGMRPGEKTAPSVIGSDLVIMGNLVSKGEVQVDGEVQGDLHCTHIVVGERARITGGVVADDVVVRGHVMGSIRGMRVTLQSSSHVEGDIYHQSLAIEQGAYFEGKSRRAEDPTAGIKTPESAASTLTNGNGLPAS